MIRYILFLVITLFSVNIAYGEVEYTLEELLRLALVRSERLKISAEDINIAAAGKKKAEAALLPQLSAIGGYTRYGTSKTSETGSLIQPEEALNYGIRLEQSISLSGKEITAFNTAKEGIEKSKLDFYAVKEGYMLLVSQSYYDVLKAKKILDISKANVERLTKHRDAALMRLKVGEVTKTALLRAEAELSGAQSELVRNSNLLKLKKSVLARIVGIEGEFDLKEEVVPERSGLDLDTAIEGCRPLTLDCLKEMAYSERAELKSLTLQKKIASEAVRIAKGAFWPNISVEGMYQRKFETPETMSIIRDNIYGGMRLNFLFFEGGLREAQVREAEVRKRQVELQYEDVKKTIGIEVEGAYLDFVTQGNMLKSLKDQYTFARENYNATARQFEYGLANSIDVMDANTLLVTAERHLADAQYNFLSSLLLIRRTTGTLLKTIPQINN
ncbi:MAG: TolC family protein [Syntrophorhabdaceae bacterium]|nr:TolC family protein [Syntrophorhabdaceae bacterium]